MTRKVHDNYMVAHLWANQSQDSARSHNGNFWFEGRTLYSYRTPIAALVPGADGNLVALLDSESYSVTTSGKHKNAARGAVRHGTPLFEVPLTDPHYSGRIAFRGKALYPNGEAECHAVNRDHLLKLYDDEVSRLMRSRDRRGTWAIEHLERLWREARQYASTFAIECPARDPAADWARACERWDRLEAKANDPKEQERRERERAKKEERKARAAERAAERALEKARDAQAEWLRGERASIPFGMDAGTVLLRARGVQRDDAGKIIGGELETSRGARVPLTHAIAIFRLQKRCRDRNESLRPEGHQRHAGPFNVDEIHANGDFRAGCHFITWAESERLARELGVFDDAPVLRLVT